MVHAQDGKLGRPGDAFVEDLGQIPPEQRLVGLIIRDLGPPHAIAVLNADHDGDREQDREELGAC